MARQLSDKILGDEEDDETSAVQSSFGFSGSYPASIFEGGSFSAPLGAGALWTSQDLTQLGSNVIADGATGSDSAAFGRGRGAHLLKPAWMS